MTIARSRQISLADTPYYHVVSRCVRRAFLCGQDDHSGQSYEHRCQWVADKLGQLSQVIAIDGKLGHPPSPSFDNSLPFHFS